MTRPGSMRWRQRGAVLVVLCCAAALGCDAGNARPVATIAAADASTAVRVPLAERESDAPLEPAAGRFLVATKQVRSGIFRRSVVWLLSVHRAGAMGLVVNKATDADIADYFPGVIGGGGTLHLGGPVEPTKILGVFRADTQPEKAQRITADVYLTSDEATLRRRAVQDAAATQLRVYAGHAAWRAGQLEAEVARGDWIVAELPTAPIFQPRSDGLWERLYRDHHRVLTREPFAPLFGVHYGRVMSHEVEHRTLARYLEDNHLKHTKQREAILEVFLEVTGHITGEDLYQRVREQHPQIGYTTVYRTMKLLCEAGLAHEHNFDGVARYEIAHEHHDHLVCTRCGKIIEFECEMIESAQEKIAAHYGFRVLRHRHELYGHCATCQKEGPRKPA